jgi:hypothetical protein
MTIRTVLDIRNATDEDLETYLYLPTQSPEIRDIRHKCLKEYAYRLALRAMMDSSIQKEVVDYFTSPFS